MIIHVCQKHVLCLSVNCDNILSRNVQNGVPKLETQVDNRDKIW